MNPQPVFQNKCEVNFLGDATLGWSDTFYSSLVGACVIPNWLCFCSISLGGSCPYHVSGFRTRKWLSCIVYLCGILCGSTSPIIDDRSYHRRYKPSSMWLFLVGVILKHRPRMVTGEGTTHRFKCAQALPVTTCLGTTASPAWANGREVIAPGQQTWVGWVVYGGFSCFWLGA
jgi:hypothetical protein